MNRPELAFSRLAGAADASHLLVVGPSLGTSVAGLWAPAASALNDAFEVVGWDLPGHGYSPPASAPFNLDQLAEAVSAQTAQLARDNRTRTIYAGLSLGGAVGLHLALTDSPFDTVVCIASSTQIGEPAAWRERADLVRRAGTPVMVSGSARRWFAPDFIATHPARASSLLDELSHVHAESYALTCEALARHDLSERITHAQVPVLVVPGELDAVVTVEQAKGTASAIPGATLHVMTGSAHLPPAEDPTGTASLLRRLVMEDETR